MAENRILCKYVAVVHTLHRAVSTLFSGPYLWQMKGGISRVGNTLFSICANSDRNEVKRCLPILSACNISAAVSLEFVYSEVWEEKCLDTRMVG